MQQPSDGQPLLLPQRQLFLLSVAALQLGVSSATICTVEARQKARENTSKGRRNGGFRCSTRTSQLISVSSAPGRSTRYSRSTWTSSCRSLSGVRFSAPETSG